MQHLPSAILLLAFQVSRVMLDTTPDPATTIDFTCADAAQGFRKGWCVTELGTDTHNYFGKLSFILLNFELSNYYQWKKTFIVALLKL
jgi:hypothetical protein